MTPQEDKNLEIGEITKSMIDLMSNFISKHSNDHDLHSLINDLGFAIYQVNQWFDYLKFQDVYFTLRNKELEDLNKAVELEDRMSGKTIQEKQIEDMKNMSSILSPLVNLSHEEKILENEMKNAAIIGKNWSIDDEE